MNLIATLTATSLLALTTPQADHPETRDIVDTAVAAGSFETLATALGSAELIGTLKGDGPFTVFAPTDAAFAKLPAETLQALLRPENKKQLTAILTYHVVSGKVSAQKAASAGEAVSLQKEKLAFRIDGGRLRVNDASVVDNDIACSNGVIHVIDEVLLPPGGVELRPPGRLIIGVQTEKPGRALADQLRIDRDATLLLTSITSKGPAALAGLRQYDIVTAIDGKPATSASLRKAKERAGYGGILELAILRRGKAQTFRLEVGVDAH